MTINFKNVYRAANAAAVTFSAVSVTTTGLCVYNPIKSGKRLIMLDWGLELTTVSAAVQNFGIAQSAVKEVQPTTNTAATLQAADGSARLGAGVAYSATTLPIAPVAVMWLGGNSWVAGAAGAAEKMQVSSSPYTWSGQFVYGALQVAPGASVSFTRVTGAVVGLGSLSWVEVPEVQNDYS